MIIINPSSSVIIYVMTITNKQLLISESHGDSNRCTPCRGKPDQHATRFPRLVRICSKTIHISHGPHIATLHEVINRVEQGHYSREKGLPTQSTPCRLTDPWVHTEFLSWANQWSSGGKAKHHWQRLLCLPGPYHWHAIGTFNTCSQGPTHRSLTDIGGRYNFEGADLPYITP
jgi:hypothetical protein